MSEDVSDLARATFYARLRYLIKIQLITSISLLAMGGFFPLGSWVYANVMCLIPSSLSVRIVRDGNIPN